MIRKYSQIGVGLVLFAVLNMGVADAAAEVRARWCAPDSGSEVEHYILEVWSGEGEIELAFDAMVAAAGDTMVHSFGEELFQFGVPHLARVRGVNGYGTGPWSEWSDPLVLDGTPGAPCMPVWGLR